MRKQSKAQLITLFMLDKEQQVLVPLAHNGKLPEAPAPASEDASDQHSSRQLAKKTLSMDGLFGSALLTQDVLQISHADADPRLLPDERAWLYPEGSVLLQTIKAGSPDRQGVLVLSFRTIQQDVQKNLTGDLHICTQAAVLATRDGSHGLINRASISWGLLSAVGEALCVYTSIGCGVVRTQISIQSEEIL